MGIISSITNAVAGGKEGRALGRAADAHTKNIEARDPTQYGYEGPEDFLSAEAATANAASMDAEQRGPAAQAAMMGAGGAADYADTLYGGYDPGDTSAIEQADLQNTAKAINLAGGRKQDQHAAAEQAAVQNNANRNRLARGEQAQLAMAKGAAGQNVAQMGTNVNVGNTTALNAQDSENTQLRQQAGILNAQNEQQANIYNAGNQQQVNLANIAAENTFNQTQADNIYTSDQNIQAQTNANQDALYDTATGKAIAKANGVRGVGEGVGGAVQSGAKIAAGGIAGGPVGALQAVG